MREWIFQGKPSRYDVADRNKVDEGKEEMWLASRFREQMHKGDIVYLWRSGDDERKGLYAWGTIESEPEFIKGFGWGVPVKYRRRFPKHLPAAELREHPELKDHLLFRMPIGTNFELTKKEADVIDQIIRNKLGQQFAAEEA